MTAKSKRCLLKRAEKQGCQLDLGTLKADYKNGAINLNGKKVAGSGGQPSTEEVLVADYGWIDAEAVCQHTRETTQIFADSWRQLVEAIN